EGFCHAQSAQAYVRHPSPRLCERRPCSVTRFQDSCFLSVTMCGINAPEWPCQFPHRLLHAASASGGWAMTFEEILDQAMAMLRRGGGVTSGRWRFQFKREEDELEALKEPLIDAERLAVDEEGRVLVWTGGADMLPLPTPPAAPRSADAERRQLTVMFCDLV